MKNLILKILTLVFFSSQLLADNGATKVGIISTTAPAQNFFLKLIVKNTVRTSSLINEDEKNRFQNFSLNQEERSFFKDNLIYFHISSGNTALDSISKDIKNLNKKAKILELGKDNGFPWLSPKVARKQLELIYNEVSRLNKGQNKSYSKNYQDADAVFGKIDAYFEKLLLNSKTIVVYQNSGLKSLAADYNLDMVTDLNIAKYRVIITDIFADDIKDVAKKSGVVVITLDPTKSNWLSQMKEFLTELNSIK